MVGFKRLEVFLKFDGLLNVNNERVVALHVLLAVGLCAAWHVMQLPADNFFPF